jgi:hypothetical protein
MLKEAKSKLEEGNIQWTNIEVNKVGSRIRQTMLRNSITNIDN